MRNNKLNPRKSERIASIVGDAFADHKDGRALMAAMIDELSKGTRWRMDALQCIKGCYPAYFGAADPTANNREKNRSID